MSVDGRILARAKARLDAMRLSRENELENRRSEAFSKNPRIAEISAKIRSTAADAIGNAILRGGDALDAINELREYNLSLQEDLARELIFTGFPPDWLEETYMCSKCHDTGYLRSGPCECLMSLYREEQEKELIGRLNLGSKTFDDFDLSLYSDAPVIGSGLSPRAAMEAVYETCVAYAQKFGSDSINLFLTGGTGLGKTMLSTCIAKDISSRGFSVVYETAAALFEKYEDARFGRGDDPAAIRSDIRAYETCDLLIIDDLGTEFTTPFTVSALYRVINTRLSANRKMIINSNFPISELKTRYSAAIMSRLQGEFEVLRFFGSDIRLPKNVE